MAPPFSSSDYFETSNISANSVNSSHILNATIIGSDIATGTITNANFVDGAITLDKLSSVLVAKLEDFDTRLTALENATPPVPAPTASITTSNPNIQGGGSTTIIPVFTNATTKTINGETTQYGQSITSTIPITVYPITTTTFTLVVTNSAGVTEQASVIIYVSEPPPPAPTASITTTNANIVNGNSTTITPVFTNATTKTINGSVTVQGQNITSTIAITVNPPTTTTYNLVVTNSAGVTREASVIINVSEPPPPPPPPSNTGFNGSITINHIGQANSYNVRVFADNSIRYDSDAYSSITFSIGTQLASPASYLYMAVEPNGRYGKSGGGFTNGGIIYYGYENGYEKYSIPSGLNNSTIVYEFDSYFDD